MPKVAIITGGASGMGLAVATALTERRSDEWSIHILDINAAKGQDVAARISVTFHLCDIANYTELASTFKKIYQEYHRLDFVHINAGIDETVDIYRGAPETGDEPPPPPNLKVLDVDFTANITGTWLALHYLKLTRKRLGDESWEGNIIFTASIVGVYAGYLRPLYSAAKAGVIGLVRSAAPQIYHSFNIRMNCICPGAVLTGVTEHLGIPDIHLTPMSAIVRAVLMLLDGQGGTDTRGVEVKAGKVNAMAVEVTRDLWLWRDIPDWPDEYLPALSKTIQDIS